MKKQLLVIALSLVTLASFGQSKKIGGHLGYGSEVESLAIGVNAEFFVTEKISVAPSFTFFFPKKEDVPFGSITATFWELNADGHYYFTEADSDLSFYGLAGLNLLGVKVKTKIDGGGSDSEGDTELGLNLGAGVNFTAGNLKPFAELKYETVGDGQVVITAGLRFPLGN